MDLSTENVYKTVTIIYYIHFKYSKYLFDRNSTETHGMCTPAVFVTVGVRHKLGHTTRTCLSARENKETEIRDESKRYDRKSATHEGSDRRVRDDFLSR